MEAFLEHARSRSSPGCVRRRGGQRGSGEGGAGQSGGPCRPPEGGALLSSRHVSQSAFSDSLLRMANSHSVPDAILFGLSLPDSWGGTMFLLKP